MTLQKTNAKKNATVYKYWLEDQTEDPKILHAVYSHDQVVFFTKNSKDQLIPNVMESK